MSHENPDADTLGAALGVCPLLEALRRPRDGGLADPVPPLYAFLAGRRAVPHRPRSRRDYDLLVLSDCGARSASARSPSGTPSCSRRCRA